MNQASEMAELTNLAQMKLDRALSDLQSTTLVRNETLRLIGELDRAASTPISSDSTGALGAREAHLLWAAAMRARLVARLGVETRNWQRLRAEAATALGRHQALRELSKRAG